MNIFQKIANSLFGDDAEKTAIPGAMGDLLATMGIHELGPHNRTGTPSNVLEGCRKKLVVIPGASRPAFSKTGKPIIAKDKHGHQYHVMENYGVPVKQWKAMQRNEERKAKGLSYNGEPTADRDARRAKMVTE